MKLPGNSMFWRSDQMIKGILLALLCGAIITLAGEVVRAAPAMPRAIAVPFDATSNVIQIEGGCGRGWHPGPIGGCERNWDPSWRCYWVRSPFGLRLICR
jgi:hypothetical protein